MKALLLYRAQRHLNTKPPGSCAVFGFLPLGYAYKQRPVVSGTCSLSEMSRASLSASGPKYHPRRPSIPSPTTSFHQAVESTSHEGLDTAMLALGPVVDHEKPRKIDMPRRQSPTLMRGTKILVLLYGQE